MKKLLTILILGIFISMTFVSAGIFDIFNKDDNVKNKPAFNITDDFNTKKLNLDKSEICVKDSNNKDKIIKADKCGKDKVKYTLVDISETNLIYKNSDDIVRVKNE